MSENKGLADKEYISNVTVDQKLVRGKLLHFAAIYGHIPVIEALLNQGADINTLNSHNKTPFGNVYGHAPL